ncbi:hypothetical protein [Aliiglaciecola sp. LCG003]|uniref:hypothetical protein n=1 Tax=Aliiglaciecola sp. LCG003 TaxID=3053655 RepID=UPI002572434D|nr:hypothetical protein [Aliiglaciecola sp. LCG003]WJG10700.1 hypothetical protein QR722_06570 [Aliiglaciecola sp. LCG003]
MQINPSQTSLFDYIYDSDKSASTLETIGKNQSKNISSGLSAFETGLQRNEFDDTLKRIEKGQIDLDVNTVEHYLQFNLQRLEQQVSSLQSRFDLQQPIRITIAEDGLQVDTQSQPELQGYLAKDQRLTSLLEQTSKLSQFMEWAAAKQQAASFQSEDMPEDTLINFLQDARKVVTEPNSIFLSSKGVTFGSQGHSQKLIEQYSENSSRK